MTACAYFRLGEPECDRGAAPGRAYCPDHLEESTDYDEPEPPPHPAEEWDHANESHVSIELIDFAKVHDHGDEIVDGLLLPGRWTAAGAGPKAGKTTFALFISVEISEGREPFDGTPIEPVTVLYVDAEMGRIDLDERLRDLGHDPLKLSRWYATDLPPKLNSIEGGNALVLAVQQLGARVVVIDGINGTVDGAEKDDTTWRPFYDYTIRPLKRMGVAIWTNDNLGKDESLGFRGSSVKHDKPDAVLMVKRIDNGVKLTAKYRRTSAYPLEQSYSIDGLEGDRPVTYRRTNSDWPPGTMEAVTVLDELNVPVDHGRTKVKQALDEARQNATDEDRYRMRNEVLRAAIRYRKNRTPEQLAGLA